MITGQHSSELELVSGSRQTRRLLLFAATTGYQLRAFTEAARRANLDVSLATDRCHVLEDPWGDRAIPVRFDQPEAALEALSGSRFDGIAALGDRPALLAGQVALALGLPFHPPAAVRACHDKFLARGIFKAAGLPVPTFFRIAVSEDPHRAAAQAGFPCVLKPLGLSASRGVIRADNGREFAAAFERIRALLARSPDIVASREETNQFIQVEEFIPGREFAVEAIVTNGRMKLLAIFDKPDPLDGPFFEETLYVTPSREPAEIQQLIRDTVERAIGALGLWHGPVHAELRVNEQGAWMLEAAARPIGGLCAKALRFGPAMPLEELVARHAVGDDISGLERSDPASGVLMIPIPKPGVYRGVEGIEEARATAHIEDVIITAKTGQELVPLPEGSSYLGFIFARANSPAEVERALRQAHGKLTFLISTALPALRPQALDRGGT